MRFGANIFLSDLTIQPVELAVELEARGFDSLWVPEHTHIPVSRRTPAPMGEPLAEEYKRCLDPLVALSLAATATTDLGLGTGVMLLAERDPIVTAKAVATLDACSQGRLRLGVGYGWNIEELENHGVTKGERRAVLRERALAMQALWSEDEASFEGEHVSFPPCWSWPKPTQSVAGRPGVPMLLGGAAGPKFLAHAAEFAAGWMPHGGSGIRAALGPLDEALARHGRDRSSFDIIPFGTQPNDSKVERYQQLGITEISIQLPSSGRDEVLGFLDDLAPLLERHRPH